MNAYWKWAGTGLKVDYLKEEEKILAILNPDQIKRITIFKPKGQKQVRSHTAAYLILDGGYRISEVLGLIFEHCDFDNLVVKVRGKGSKHRLVPLSMEMRRVLYRYGTKHSGPGRLRFGTRNKQVTVRNFERDLKALGERMDMTGVFFLASLAPFQRALRMRMGCKWNRDVTNLELIQEVDTFYASAPKIALPNFVAVIHFLMKLKVHRRYNSN